jgi:GT2 family glycosyltransferase
MSQNKRTNILTIIVTYNRKDLLSECLTAINSSLQKTDVLVIDNNSTDGTKEMIEDLKSSFETELIHINTGSNLGGAGGYNYGVREAIKLSKNADHKYKYFYLMDDDTIIKPDSLKVLIDTAAKLNDKFGFLSSKALWKDGSICKTNVQRKAVARRINDFNTPLVPVDYASFVSLLIKEEDVVALGLPIKEFFIWSDDLEYTRRFSKKEKSYLVNESIVIHKCAENIGVDITKEKDIKRIERYKYIYRNDVYTFKKEGLRGIIFLFVRFLYHMLKIIFIAPRKFDKIKTVILSHIDGFKFNPQIEYVR